MMHTEAYLHTVERIEVQVGLEVRRGGHLGAIEVRERERNG